MSGLGQLYSWVIVHHPVHPGATGRVPYIVALVNLAEGPRIVTNLVNCRPSLLQSDLAVELVWDTTGSRVPLPKFQPRALD
jgi:hypothetical protein